MNRKGFTLVELLAVIVIIALLALITTTSVTKFVGDAKNNLSNVQIGLIKSAAEAWGADNINKFPEANKCSYITLKDLKNQGFIDSSVIDPKTNKKISDDLKIKISNTLSEYGKEIISYEVNPQNTNNCEWAYPCKYTKDTDRNEMITCGTENFYGITKEDGKVEMLSKYNITLLKTNPSQNTTGTTNGITFATNAYWNTYDGETGDYTEEFSEYKVGGDKYGQYPYVYDSRSNIYSYVEAYRDVLEGIGVNVIDAKLLSYEQAEDLGCTTQATGFIYCSSAPSWITGTFWLGSGSVGGPWHITNHEGPLSLYYIPIYGKAGIRPVVTIKSYDLK